MNIALFGYGKMGKLIEQIAIQRGHEVVARIDINNSDQELNEIDIAIDFSTPEAAFDNISRCLNSGIPVVSGTTGWTDRYPEAVALCEKQGGALLCASNFSLGVNIFFAINKQLAKLIGPIEDYQLSIEETHHIHKLDAPSGTAISLADDIIANSSHESWSLETEGGNGIPIRSKREGEVPGIHCVTYRGPVDEIEIRHEAFNRNGFALGAVIAAEWLQGKTGVFAMEDVLNLR